MEDGGEQNLLVGRNTENGFGNGAIDWEGNTVIPFVYLYVDFFSEGLAAVRDKKRHRLCESKRRGCDSFAV
ncbi:MAG: WG repeat-containing protein [Anaerotignum faecicola]